jgi:hypothetical protein
VALSGTFNTRKAPPCMLEVLGFKFDAGILPIGQCRQKCTADANQARIFDSRRHEPLRRKSIALFVPHSETNTFPLHSHIRTVAMNSPSLHSDSDVAVILLDNPPVNALSHPTRTRLAGVKFVFGTDTPVVSIEQSYEEFLEYQRIGLTPTEAIKTATVNAAEALKMSDQIGSIATGKIVDIIAVDGNPEADLRALGAVKFVMKGGAIIKGTQ